MITDIHSEDRLVQTTFADHLRDVLGWDSIYAHNEETFGPTGTLGRASDRDVVLTRDLRAAVDRLNPELPEAVRAQAVETLARVDFARSLIQHNREFYGFIRNGVPVEWRDANGQTRHARARVIDFKNENGPDGKPNNRFLAVRELKIQGLRVPHYNRRADLVCFVNGLPLVFIELKAVYLNMRAGFDNNLTDYDRYELKLSKQVGPLVKEWCDLLLFGNYFTKVAENDNGRKRGVGGRERKLYTTHSAAWDAKNRHGFDEMLPFEFAAIAPAFTGNTNATPTPAAPVAQPAPSLTDKLAELFAGKEDQVNAFLLARQQIKPDQTWRDVPAEYAQRVQPSGATFFDHLVFTESAFWKIDAFRAATGENVTPDQDVEIRADDLIGRTGRARLIVEEFNGRKRNKIAAWLAPKPTNTALASAYGEGRDGQMTLFADIPESDRVSKQHFHDAMRQTGLDITTLQHYAYVARHVPRSLRNEHVSWEYHRKVAKLRDDDEKRRWLELAAEMFLDGNATRAIAACRVAPGDRCCAGEALFEGPQPVGHGDVGGVTDDLAHIDGRASTAALADHFHDLRCHDLADEFDGDFRDRIDHAS